jgi:serine/threonine-protein kinase
MIQAGARIGNYQLIKELGAGGMGVVWIAEQLGLDREVAIKVLDKSFADKPGAVSRFFTEARAANRIRHEHIVEVTDSGQAPSGEHYYVMELLQGQTLGACIKRDGAMPLGRILHIALQVTDALAASHAAGIIHRDLKPDNIFLISRHGDVDYVKVLDFGVAKLLGGKEEGAHLTRTGAALGTPLYMSPEQAMGRKEIDHRTDVYALGVILFEMAIGSRPHDGDSATEVIMKHLTLPFPSMRDLNPEISLAFEKIQRRAVTREADERWQTMAELRAALLELARRESVSVSISGGTGRLFIGALPDGPASVSSPGLTPVPAGVAAAVSSVSSPALATTMGLATGERAVSPAPKKSALVPAAVGVVLVACVGGALLMMRSSGTRPEVAAPAAAPTAPAAAARVGPDVGSAAAPPTGPASATAGDAGATPTTPAPAAPPAGDAGTAGAPSGDAGGTAATPAAQAAPAEATPAEAAAPPAAAAAPRARTHHKKRTTARAAAPAPVAKPGARPAAPAPAAAPPAAPSAPGSVPLRFRVKGG